jgi:hypothetical protein
MKPPLPKELDFNVEVEQGKTKRILPIRAPSKEKAINQANRILKVQGVKPARVIGATERKP